MKQINTSGKNKKRPNGEVGHVNFEKFNCRHVPHRVAPAAVRTLFLLQKEPPSMSSGGGPSWSAGACELWGRGRTAGPEARPACVHWSHPGLRSVCVQVAGIIMQVV